MHEVQKKWNTCYFIWTRLYSETMPRQEEVLFFSWKKKSLSLAEWSWIQIINIKTWKGRIRSKLFGLRQAMDGRNSSAEHKI